MESVDELRAILAAERMEGNRIYVVARLIGILRWRGIKIWATDEDWQKVIAARDAARAGCDARVLNLLPRGYEIARWHMVIRAIRPYEELGITEDDLIAIRDAFLEFQVEKNFDQQASLFQTCACIGAKPILPEYTLQEICCLGNALQKLQYDVD